jgi:phage tail-like protein
MSPGSTTALDRPSTYLDYLPGIYQHDAEKGAFVGRYLKIFEKLLSGIDDDSVSHVSITGMEQVVARLHEFFDPESAPREFLDWLAGWMALALREDWEESKKRRLISRILPLYRIRGTKQGLEEYITIYLPNVSVDITEVVTAFQVGEASTIGRDTYVGGGPPHFFIVTIVLPEPKLELKQVREEEVRAIIDLEKPAHTYYHLNTIVPTLRIGQFSHVGVDTLLGDIA